MVVCYKPSNALSTAVRNGVTGVADPEIPADYLESVKELTRWYNAKLEEAIRMSPEQYCGCIVRWRALPAPKTKPKSKHKRPTDAAAA